MKLNYNKKIFLVWGRETELSRYLANGLGAELTQVYYKKIGNYDIPVFFRYIFQAVETLSILFEKRPAAVIVQNPPVFAPLVVAFYCRITGAKFAIDSHTAAFLDDKWKSFYGLFKFAAGRAALNSCHNYKNLEILKSWAVSPAMVAQFYNPVYDLRELSGPLADDNLEKELAESDFPVLMVNRFAPDDDYETVFKTAELMPEAKFFITGEPKEAGGKIKNLPANVFLTGYLPRKEFLKLMSRVKVVLAFTLRPDTVLWSVREAMALNKPFITTDSEVLRHYYGEAGLFAKSNAEEIKKRILEAAENEDMIKNKIKIFLNKDKIRWDNEVAAYKNYIN